MRHLRSDKLEYLYLKGICLFGKRNTRNEKSDTRIEDLFFLGKA